MNFMTGLTLFSFTPKLSLNGYFIRDILYCLPSGMLDNANVNKIPKQAETLCNFSAFSMSSPTLAHSQARLLATSPHFHFAQTALAMSAVKSLFFGIGDHICKSGSLNVSGCFDILPKEGKANARGLFGTGTGNGQHSTVASMPTLPVKTNAGEEVEQVWTKQHRELPSGILTRGWATPFTVLLFLCTIVPNSLAQKTSEEGGAGGDNGAAAVVRLSFYSTVLGEP
jgi:hypothetical protein